MLADSTYPLILKWIGAVREGGNVLQTTRIDLPYLIVPVNGVAAGEAFSWSGARGSGRRRGPLPQRAPARQTPPRSSASSPHHAASSSRESTAPSTARTSLPRRTTPSPRSPAFSRAIPTGPRRSRGTPTASARRRRTRRCRSGAWRRCARGSSSGTRLPRRACAWLDMAPRGRGSRTARSKGGHAIGEWSWCATVPGSGELP